MRHLRIAVPLVALLFSLIAIASCNPFKVTDPTDPRFEPTKFMFEDYTNRQELYGAISSILRVGTDMEMVDKILVHGAGAQKVPSIDSNVVRYHYRPWYSTLRGFITLSNFDGWSIYVTYTDEKLTKYAISFHN